MLEKVSMPKHSTTSKRPHFDRPEVSEILVDTLRGVDINGGVLRFEFVVNRSTEPKNDKSEGSRTLYGVSPSSPNRRSIRPLR
jgi:hypothetical protein